MDNEGNAIPIGRRKETKLVIGGFVSPRRIYRLEFTAEFPLISPFTPSDPFELINPLDKREVGFNEEMRVSPGWYFALDEGETAFHNDNLQRLQEYCRELFSFLNKNYPIYYYGRRKIWSIGSLNTTRLKLFGELHIEVEDAYKFPELFQQGMSAFEKIDVFPPEINTELRSKQRSQARAWCLEENIKAMKFHPVRMERAINSLVAKKGLSRNNAFREVSQLYQDNGNVGQVESVGEAYGPWLNGRVASTEANNNVQNGGASQASKPVNATKQSSTGAVAAPPVPAKPVNATKQSSTGAVAAPPVPAQPAKPVPLAAAWHVETANQKRKRLANAATKRAANSTQNEKKGGRRRRKTKRSKRSV